jgi:hypothetical protein
MIFYRLTDLFTVLAKVEGFHTLTRRRLQVRLCLILLTFGYLLANPAHLESP